MVEMGLLKVSEKKSIGLDFLKKQYIWDFKTKSY